MESPFEELSTVSSNLATLKSFFKRFFIAMASGIYIDDVVVYKLIMFSYKKQSLTETQKECHEIP